MSLDTRKRVILLKEQGFSVSRITARLQQEGIFVSCQALCSLFKKHSDTGRLVDLPKQTRTKKINEEMIAVTDDALLNNDELTARVT